ncbi:MAG: hypothetical protein FWC16_02855 [Defluviitaleaceae bacterium]|nr:hypothetical protein [Defluviitaleaceae bacterium]MCL2273840.1 hypothetical protein [Defluviitaleaceae bacterium]
MKKVLLIATPFLLSIMLVACANAATPFQSTHNDWQGLYMYVAQGSVTPTGLRLSMTNNNADMNFGHGVMFAIEEYVSGTWRQVPFINEVAWILPLLSVPPNTIVDENISWEHMHGQLPPGKYRIVRNFMENNWDATPMWQRDISDAYLYATFTIQRDWQTAHDQWQREQEIVAAAAYARFDGLDVTILTYSTRGLSFTITNNHPNYSYLISSIFVGWEDSAPGWGSASALEYSIFRDRESPEVKRLAPGEYLSMDVDWYNQIGDLTPSMARPYPFNAHIFDLVVDVTLDVDEEYIARYLYHRIPGLPNVWHRLRTPFDISAMVISNTRQ